MLYSFGFDCHIGGKYEKAGAKEELLALLPGPTVYLGADNVELSVCSMSDLKSNLTLNWLLKERHGANMLWGNHDHPLKPSYQDEEDNFIIITTPSGKRYKMRHGHREANKTKWYKYDQDEYGASWFKIHVWTKIVLFTEFVGLRPIPQHFLEAAAADAKASNCDGYLGGHYHPHNLRRQTFNGIDIIVFPQGVTHLDLS